MPTKVVFLYNNHLHLQVKAIAACGGISLGLGGGLTGVLCAATKTLNRGISEFVVLAADAGG